MKTTIPRIEFHKVRDFGEIFNDAFIFLKYHSTSLLIPILYVALPFMLFNLVLSMLIADSYSFEEDMQGLGIFSTDLSFKFALAIPVAALINALVYNYILLYIEKDMNFSSKELWQKAIQVIAPFIALSFIYVILVFIAALCLILPGIFVGVLFSMIFAVFVFEKPPVLATFRRCQTLLQDNATRSLSLSKWFNLLVVIVVATIIQGVFRFILEVPFAIFSFIDDFEIMSYSPTLAHFADALYESTSFLISFVASMISTVVITFQYFSFREEQESTSMFNKIEEFGKSSPNRYENL